MKPASISIDKNLKLPLAADYKQLRTEGFTAIEELGSEQWTDYNAHDPGITLLENFIYALTEIGYKVGFDIADILTEQSGYISFRQALFTARKILTNNALTVNDFRKVLIDLPKVHNGWLNCKKCVCETSIYAECNENQLFHAPQWRLQDWKTQKPIKQEQAIEVQGLYDVLVQLEDDPEFGDLNNRKLTQTLAVNIQQGDALVPLTIEMRFPDWKAANPDIYKKFISDTINFQFSIALDRFSRDQEVGEEVDNASLIQGWRNLFFADFSISFQVNIGEPVETFSLNAVPIRFFSTSEAVKRTIDVTYIKTILKNIEPGGLIDRYRRKLMAIEEVLAHTRHQLHMVRNLSEDFCKIQTIQTEDVAACMDVVVRPDADIENVLAHIFFEIEQHFNPTVPFYTLSELVNEGIPTEDVFLGPPLENGFIKEEDLDAAELRPYIQVSDLYNRLMDIEGIIAIKNVLFTKYDDQGNAIMPAHQWKIPLRPLHIAKLYTEASRILFYKDALPFVARMDEVTAILAQLRGKQVQGKVALAERDYPIPTGKHRNLADYEPLQHTLPQTYGIGPAGLNPRVSDKRKAEARQLKAYLMPFEQLLADMTAQLAHVPDLFSTDETVDRTYFTHYFDATVPEPAIANYNDLVTTEATEDNLRTLAEPGSVFEDRRNRFLDHILARFGEQFRDYALMLHANEDRIPFAADKLIRDKIRFLRFYPRISADRGRAFNYRFENRWCDPRNQSGIAERISRLLGLETLKGYFSVEISSHQGVFEASFTLTDTTEGGLGLLLLQNQLIQANTGEAAEDLAWSLIGDIMANSTVNNQYITVGTDTHLEDENGQLLASLANGITAANVIDFTRDILAKERLFVLEHLLLRPTFPGSPLMPVCLPLDCTCCGDEDPYSFRLTYILQGDLAPFNYDIDLRRFADQSIRKETPAHLLPKICWVSNKGLEKDECSPVFRRLMEFLQQYQGMPAENETDLEAICACSHEIYDGFDELFQSWMLDKTLLYRPRPLWEQDIISLFNSIQRTDFPCLTLNNGWDIIKETLLNHFIDLASGAYQFDRFELAFCAWLESNAPFLWQPLNEQLRQQTELWLQEIPIGENTYQYCQCAQLMLAYFGDQFRYWIDGLVENEADLTNGDALNESLSTTVWDAFMLDLKTIMKNDPGFCGLAQLEQNDPTWLTLKSIWINIYQDFIQVSYRLNILLRIINNLHSIYPTATLHDCDDGSDDNPVQLDNTILGTL